MVIDKKVSVANFNVVFQEGELEKPLLNHFDDIVMPALLSGKRRKSGDCTYLLTDVHVNICATEDIVLTGHIVKKTILEIKSDIDEDGNLIEKDDKYPTAPYSTFIIYLKNHRMIFAENQKGSPSLKNFKAMINYLFTQYIRDQFLKEEYDETNIPIPLVHVVGIPMRENITKALEQVEKVNSLTLRFYPLNGDGDIDFSSMFEGMAKDVRKMVGSKCGEIIYKSPRNIQGVIDIVEKSEGTVDPIFRVTYSGKKKGTIKNDMISEKTTIQIDMETSDDELECLIEYGKNVDSITYVSKENEKIYSDNQCKIIPFLRK